MFEIEQKTREECASVCVESTLWTKNAKNKKKFKNLLEL